MSNLTSGVDVRDCFDELTIDNMGYSIYVISSINI